jgi:hypothetical protein
MPKGGRRTGAGRKRKRADERRVAVLIRVDPATRAALAMRAKAPGSISRTAERLLKIGLGQERDRRRDDPTRALCHIVGELAGMMAIYKNVKGRPAFPWRNNPFMFEALKLAIVKVMDELRPAVDMPSPIESEPVLATSTVWGPHDTPEARATWAAHILWANLLTEHPVRIAATQAEKEIQDTAYGMNDARKDLGLNSLPHRPPAPPNRSDKAKITGLMS